MFMVRKTIVSMGTQKGAPTYNKEIEFKWLA